MAAASMTHQTPTGMKGLIGLKNMRKAVAVLLFVASPQLVQPENLR
jgi:hypothetical protein